MTRSTKTERYVALLEAAVAAARDLLDETVDGGDVATRLADRLDDVDAYCERCDDEGVVAQNRTVSTAYVGPPIVDEVPCDCEASRVLREKREEVPC